ncbi:MAG TPA: ADOP family duplicated permease [Opitutaceae bacterium]|nr:ADOP family duplicated permease [Opitutaceae bacterium]
MLADLRFALRTLTKTPGLSFVIVVSLALGIGANTTIFSWLNGALFRPLPGVSADLFCVEPRDAAGTYTDSSWLEYRDLLDRLPSFAHLVAQRPRPLSLGDNANGERLWGELVSGNFFTALGVKPALGRFFLPEEAAPNASAPVVVISHPLWQRQFGGRADAIGRTIQLNHRTLTVIGVAPAEFVGGWTSLAFDVWVPLALATELTPATSELTNRTNRSYSLLGVLRPGVTRAQAAAELAAAARALAAEDPDTNAGIRFELLPLWRNPHGGALLSGALATLQLFAALVLVVVCVNTANLLLARASVRRREIGIRLACGASVARVLRLLLTESLLLALAGAALGAMFSLWGIDALRQLPVPTNLPVRLHVALDWRGLLFAAGVGIACGVVFGLAPAWQLARADVQQALRGGHGFVGGRSRLRDALVALEVAVALVVLVLAGLFTKSFRNAQSIDPGYTPDRVLLVTADLVGRGYTPSAMLAFVRDAQARLAQLPGVEAVAAVNILPLDLRGALKESITVDGAPPISSVPHAPRDAARILFFNTTRGYFSAMGIPLLAGTDLAPLDDTQRPPDAVINEEMARRFWPGISPLGHRFRLDGRNFEVVGVVRNAKYESLSERPQPAAWPNARNLWLFTPVFNLRVASGDPLRLLPAVREVFRALDPEVSVYDGRTLAQHVDNSLFLQRAPAQMLGLLGPLALALAAIGLYAVLAYSLAQRTQEIGVRLTLGATPASVVALMVRESMKIVLGGAALGWFVAFWLGWFFHQKLVGVPVGDPFVYAGAPALLLAVATLACWLPARRATRVDPMIALRAE